MPTSGNQIWTAKCLNHLSFNHLKDIYTMNARIIHSILSISTQMITYPILTSTHPYTFDALPRQQNLPQMQPIKLHWYIYKTICYYLCSTDKIVLCVASSSICYALWGVWLIGSCFNTARSFKLILIAG